VHEGLLDPKLTFFLDEANFNISGYVNLQTTGAGVVKTLMH
jgi:hypothetical protein